MKYVGASPSDSGKTTRVTIEVSKEEAHALVKLFESGRLAEFGISRMTSEPRQQPDQRGKWVERAEDKTPSDKPRGPSS